MLANLSYPSYGQSHPIPPESRREDFVEEINGMKIADPYRWLEDGKSPETRAWTQAQNEYTKSVLSQIKGRDKIMARISELARVDSVGVPTERGGRYFFSKRLSDEELSKIYFRETLTGEDILLLDPFAFAGDGSISVGLSAISKDGKLIAFSLRKFGADEVDIHLMNVDTREELPEKFLQMRFTEMYITPDKMGIYYTNHTESGPRVYFHKMGTDPAEDELIFGEELDAEKFISIYLTEDGKYLLITVSRGWIEDELYLMALEGARTLKTIVSGISSAFAGFIGGDNLFILTNYNAPKWKVFSASLSAPQMQNWREIIPETEDSISSLSLAGGKLFCVYLHNATSYLRAFDEEGHFLYDIVPPGVGSASDEASAPALESGHFRPAPMPARALEAGHSCPAPMPTRALEAGHSCPALVSQIPMNAPASPPPSLLGSISGMSGRWDSAEAFYSFSTFHIPPTIYRYETTKNESTIWFRQEVPIKIDDFTSKQVWFTSKDGTEVPMFIVHRKGLKLNGENPTLLTGYGGFNISITPYFLGANALFLENGGVFAIANLRGGGEFGEEWHKAGMLANKQNVFDDFTSAAEWLIKQGYTNPNKLAIMGGSNGGLLVGAALTQRPKLFRAVVCTYPLLDMLRYHKFRVGELWIAEYGDPDNPEDFAYLKAYSPYHNVKEGVEYPAVLFVTGDFDTRVDPMHARKMTALLQHASASDPALKPVLLSYDTKAGHSGGLKMTEWIERETDQFLFLFWQLGMLETPPR